MSPERAKHILDTAHAGGDFRFAYLRAFVASGSLVYEDGITEADNREIKAVWETMPGWTCYHDAVRRIAGGEEGLC